MSMTRPLAHDTVAEILDLSDRGVSMRDICAATAVPAARVREVVSVGIRMARLLACANASPRQQVRTLAARLEALVERIEREVATDQQTSQRVARLRPARPNPREETSA